MVDRIIKNGNIGSKNLLSSIIANGIISTEIKVIIIIQFALIFFSFCSTGLKENKIPNGIRINRYGYDILIKMLSKLDNPLASLSINPRIPCFSTKSTTPTFSGVVNNSA